MASMPKAESDMPVRRVAIIGGGTAGWMSAAGLVGILGDSVEVTLIESAAIGTIGVGEATLPHIRFFNQRLGIDENELMAATGATYKLGIEFRDWGRIGDSYIHPFGDFGFPINRVGFHHYLARARAQGSDPHLDAFSLPVMAARKNRFQPPHPDPDNVLSTFGYAYQFDAGLYAKFLRGWCEARGASRIEGRVVDVRQDAESGHVTSVRLEDGRTMEADFFIDCSGFRGLLIEQALGTGYKDWTNYLPCDAAVTAACDPVGPLRPYTTATARRSGWTWRIPLQHRVGNGYVYSSRFEDDDAARDVLLGALESPAKTEPRTLRFTTGQRKKSWVGNVVAVGLSGGFLEPLESTGIYLIQEAITTLIEMFPQNGWDAAEPAEYNRIMDEQFERVRDFLLLHYVATERDDSPFWRHMRGLDLPGSLAEKMALFTRSGRVTSYEVGAFKDASWLAVYLGQGVWPAGYDPVADHLSDAELRAEIDRARGVIDRATDGMSAHERYIDAHCKAA